MIVNIVDERTNKFNVMCNAIFEPACHDNKVEGATQHIDDAEREFAMLVNFQIVEALEYGTNLAGSYTLFLSDAINRDA